MKKTILPLIALAVLLISAPTNAQTLDINTFAGNGTGGYSGDGAAATAAELNIPIGVAVDVAGNVYIADYVNNRIREVNKSTGIITTIAGNGTAGYSGDGGAATAAELNYPFGVAVDAAGNVYIADRSNNRIREVNTSGIISTIAGNGTGGYSGDGAAATAAELNQSIGVSVDAVGNVYIADYGNQRIREVNKTTGIISTIAGNGTAGYSGDGAAATAAELYAPFGVAVDVAGNVYIADLNNYRIRKINTSGIISTIAGNGTAGYSGDGAAATTAELNSPTGITVDASGNVYIADFSNSRIREINTSGIISTIAGNGAGGYSGDGGAATAAEINQAEGVAVDAAGNVYIADRGNNRIRKVSSCTNTGDTTATACSSFMWYGTNYTSTGTPTHILTNKGGCDSTVTLHLTINEPTTSSLTATACSSYSLNSSTYNTSGTYTQNLTNKKGCDSTLTLHLTVTNILNQTLTAAQSSGCDSLSTAINLSSSQSGINYYLRNNATDSIVAGPVAGTGSGISLNTGMIHSSTTYNVYANGGSTTNGSLIFGGNAEHGSVDLGTNINNTIAGTKSITVEAWVYRTPTSTLETVIGNYGSANMQFLLRISANVATFWVSNGSGYTQAVGATTLPTNTWIHLAGTWDGTTIKVYLNGVLDGSVPYSGVFPTNTNNVQIGGGLSNNTEFFDGNIADVSIWKTTRTASQINNDKNYCLSGAESRLLALYNMTDGTGSSTVTDASGNGYNGTLTNMPTNTSWGAGAPSVTCYSCSLQMSSLETLVINHPTTSSLTETACSSYTLNSSTYNTSGTYIQNLTNERGCDSTLTLHLTINQPNTGDTTATACSSFMWYGTNYTSTGTPTHVLTNKGGCDSTLTLHLTINYPNSGDTTATACSSFMWYGTNYTSSGTPTHLLTNMTGCDSTLTLHLTINQPNTGDTTATACSSFMWYGTNYTSSGTPTHLLTNMTGCDSTLILHLTINQPNTGDTTATACSSFMWYGTNYTSSGTPTHLLTNMTGCDSTLTLNLTINQPTTSTITTTACSTYTLNSQTFNTSGTYTQNLMSAGGCDSTLTLNLTIDRADTIVTQMEDTLIAHANSATYQWIKCGSQDSTIAGATNQSYIPAVNGYYAVVVTQGGCSDTSACHNVTTTGVNNYSLNGNNINIYPVPNNGNFAITFAGLGYQSITIYNETGKKVSAQLLDEKNANISLNINLSMYPNGIYFAQILTSHGLENKKIVIQK